MGKGPTLRPSKAKQSARAQNGGHEQDEEDESKDTRSFSSTLRENFPDPIAVLAAIALVLMMVALGLLLWVNSSKDIQSCMHEINRDVEVLDTERDHASGRRRKDHEDLSEINAALEAIDRAVHLGNTPAARRIVAQLSSSHAITEADVASLTALIDSAEAANPIADLSSCRPDSVLSWIKDNGGSIIDATGAPPGGTGNGIVLMDLDRPDPDAAAAAAAAGPGNRGLIFIRDAPAGERVLAVPSALFLSLWADPAASPALPPALAERAAGAVDAFTALAAVLLAESHNATGYFRKYICSLPVHVPLPFRWEEEELPADFLADAAAAEGRLLVRRLVERSFNTSARLVEKYPTIFKAEHMTRSKWDWACTIILSRSLSLRRPAPAPRGRGAPPPPPTPTLDTAATSSSRWILDILSAGGGGGGGGGGKDEEAQVLIPGVDFLNHHEGDPDTAVRVAIEPAAAKGAAGGATAVVTVGPGGAVRGLEAAMIYGDSDAMCGTRPLNRYGFVMPPCPTADGAAGAAGAAAA